MTTPIRNKGGAPKDNQNRLVQGKYTREAIQFRRRVREHLREVRTMIAETRALLGRDKQCDRINPKTIDSTAPARCPSRDNPPRNRADSSAGICGRCCAVR
jgi:hypothetical protein